MHRFSVLRHRGQLVIASVLGAVTVLAVTILYVNLTKDLRLLQSASSDNVQWSLSQTEVEFIELEMQLERASRSDRPDLAKVRREFDIFYSRVVTLERSGIYSSLRSIERFGTNFQVLKSFMDDAVKTIDASNVDLLQSLPQLAASATAIRPVVRSLTTSGLDYFAQVSDQRRGNISRTLMQSAFGVTLLVLALFFFTLYLVRLNRLNNSRRKEVIEASTRMNIVTSTALDAVIVSDADGIILDFNLAAEQIFGHNAKDAIGSNLGDLIVPDQYRDAHDAGMRRMRDHGEMRVVGKGRITLEAKRANGEIFPVEFALHTATTSKGRIFVSFLRDISSRIAAEQELVAARDRAVAGAKAKTDFLATMSHEIRTPLNGLLGNLTLLGDTPLSAKQARYVRNMETSGKLLMSHIADVLDITKYDAGKLELRPSPMNISTLLQDIIDNQSGAAESRNTSLELHWTGDAGNWINADQDRIQHVLMNVIGNAAKFTRNGRIDVVAHMTDGCAGRSDLEVKVIDTGIGMDADLKAQIFDDFLTGDTSYKRDVGGTGLGLGIALRFIKALGGTIDVQSEPNKGSTFTIRFPVDRIDPPALSAHQAINSIGITPLRVLLVEDNEINRELAQEMLISAGHKVSTADNGAIAVQKAMDHVFDLILMDISMPEMDGRTATRAIRASNGVSAKTPIIALTANAMTEEKNAYRSDGMNDVLTKPLSRSSLMNVIEQIGAGAARGLESSVQTSSFTLPLVDADQLNELAETLGSDAAKRLLERFEQEFNEALTFFGSAKDYPMDDVASYAHKIAGSAATFGALELRAVLTAIEKAAKHKDEQGVEHAILGLPELWQQTYARLVI